ncbi:MAG: PLP-dependent aminotransferase family protein [Paracoccus sp. (in: a-proteobacteria)]|uniref:aminotransferase-like domain-containing protein n=1 Tax=Paracoccus sp. TaxID=267 RepID=UPI0026DED944|nr:PLP-dependent aminotransferase family protein [Paracoccus sp. (in: a-proteobacteria)]MDO5622900.1 PLP-dependent aminotransferase family protein [Paracoccus sp. (in: a-proteobacteria)]
MRQDDPDPFSTASSSRPPGNQAERLWCKPRDWLLRQIEDGTLAPGERLPSLRDLSRLFGISLNTARRAIDDLVDTARVITVPRSGYFVAEREPTVSALALDGVDVRVDHKVVAMMEQARRDDLLPLASAVLSSSLVPTDLLGRCMRAVARAQDSAAGFIPPPGDLELRRRIAGLMVRRGVDCTAEDVLVTAGDTVALELALLALGRAGDCVIVEDPTYFGILQAIEHVGMRAVPIRVGADGIDLDQLAAALRTRPPAAIFLNPTLQNPCGFVMSEASRLRLVELSTAAGVAIIEDDVFYDLLPEGRQVVPIKALAPGDVLYCSSFTKTVAPGYRVGWCLPGRHYSAVLAQMHGRNLSVSSLPQAVLAEFLRRDYHGAHIARLRGSFARSSAGFARLVSARFPAGTRYQAPVGGFIHWVKLPATIDVETFHSEAEALGIAIAKGDIFSLGSAGSQSLRFCLSGPLDSEVTRALIGLGALAERLQGSRTPANHKTTCID